jgi:hypothetical protein
MTLSYRLLSVAERRCIGALALPEPLSNLPRLGKTSVDRLLQLGLIEKAHAPKGSRESYYRRTAAGNEVYEQMWQGSAIPR